MSAPFGGVAPQKRRTGQPVRRPSYHRGEREHRIWRALGATPKEAWRFRRALVTAAKRYDDSTKNAGDRSGAIGLTGIKVLETLLTFVDNMSGRLEPAIDTIAAKAKLARGTVVRALARLKEARFLDWLRRTEALDTKGAGPQVQQVTNAYWFALSGRAAGLVRLLMGKAPSAAKTREEVDADARADRNGRLHAMQARRQVAAGDVLSEEAKASLARLREIRSASPIISQNPGSKG